MASVKFLLNRPKFNKPTSILVRFHSKQTQSITLSTGEMVLPEHWDGQRVTSKHRKQYDRINRRLSQMEADLLELWRDNIGATGEALTLLVQKVVKGESNAVQKKTVCEAVKKFIAQYEREKEEGTVKRYKSLLNKLEAFNPDLTFEALDVNFYDEFKKFLYGNDNPVYAGSHLQYNPSDRTYIVCANSDANKDKRIPIGLFDDVVFKYFINLKTVCAWAEKRGYHVHPAYKGSKDWEIIKREYPVISFTQDELHKIESLHLPERHLDVARDFLCLECRTGQRISDLRRFNKSDISGHTWIFNQKKGSRTNEKTVSLPLVGYCAPALVILQKYNYELPIISEQKLNKHIKTICRLAGINNEIYITRWAGNKKIRIPGRKYEFASSHIGRKTFITIALQFMSPQMVMNITGIRSFNTLKHYSGESEIGLIEEGLRKIENDKAVMKKSG